MSEKTGMKAESLIIAYAMRSFSNYLIDQGLINESDFIKYMQDVKFELRGNMQSSDEAQALVSSVFNIITGEFDDE